MSRTLKFTLFASLFAVVSFLSLTGCKKAPSPAEPEKPATEAPAVTVEEVVEKAEAAAEEVVEKAEETVEETVEKVVETALCPKCGQVKGTPLCCKPGAEKCPKCSLHKGSPGCCKLPK